MLSRRANCDAALRLGATLVLALWTLPALAEDAGEPSAAKGEKLAQTLCSSCHVVDETSAASVPAGIPTLRAIANKTGQTGEHIRDILIAPHAPMPQMSLSNDEILSLVAYLETRRTNPDVPPLVTPAMRDRTIRPKSG